MSPSTITVVNRNGRSWFTLIARHNHLPLVNIALFAHGWHGWYSRWGFDALVGGLAPVQSVQIPDDQCEAELTKFLGGLDFRVRERTCAAS